MIFDTNMTTLKCYLRRTSNKNSFR